ncbi:MAG: hypothetical protein M3Q07_01715 [Pseudobdellovibrionaceae bacterium]|nr:hypothetical protein [Pseudobdellovibrionaceae bacterium]
MMERKQSAAERLGSLGSQLQGRDFTQAARKAEAQDAISRFNTANSIQRQQANTNIANDASQQNWNRNNTTADRNTASNYDFRKDSLDVQQGGAQMSYNKATDDYNRAQLKKQQKAAKRSGVGSMLGGLAGGAAGAYFGGPAGAAAGYQVGSSLGGNFAKGGRVPGPELFPGDNEMNDIFDAQLSPGEIVIPKSIAGDPVASAKFVAAQNQGMDPLASKYIAQNADLAAAEKVPFYPTPDGAPIPSGPKFDRRTDGDMASRTKQTARPAAIPEPVLAQLAKSNPSLVEQYRQRMGSQDQAVADAESRQGMLGTANLVGKGLTDFANSQKEDVILKNRMQDLGRRPDVVEAQRKAYDGSMLDKMGAQDVQRAKEGRNRAEDSFFTEQKLGAADKAMAKEAALSDPNSPESVSARAFLKALVPTASKLQGFEGMTAAQLEKAQPMLMERWKADRAQANADREFGLKEKELNIKKSGTKKLSGEEQKRLDSAGMALAGIQGMRQALAKGDNTFSPVGDNDFTVWRRDFEEGLGRMQSGGAITDDEAERFRDSAPTWKDSAEMKQKKLAKLEAEMGARIRGLGADPEQSLAERGVKEYKQAPAGQRVRQNGVTFVWNGSEYEAE